MTNPEEILGSIATPLPARGDKPAGFMFNYEMLLAAAQKKYPDVPADTAVTMWVRDFKSASDGMFVNPTASDKWEGNNMNIGRIPFDNRIDAGGPPEDF